MLWLQMYVYDILRICVRIEIDTDKTASFCFEVEGWIDKHTNVLLSIMYVT